MATPRRLRLRCNYAATTLQLRCNCGGKRRGAFTCPCALLAHSVVQPSVAPPHRHQLQLQVHVYLGAGAGRRSRAQHRGCPPLGPVRMQCESRGFLLERTGTASDGRSVSLHWKAWTTPGSDELKWEVRRVLPTLGYEQHSEHTKVHQYVRDQHAAWRKLWELCGFEPGECFGRSRHSIAHGASADGADAQDPEQEYWLSTRGLLGCLSFWHRHRRELAAKRVVEAAFRLFLEHACDADSLLGVLIAAPAAEVEEACSEAPQSQGRCACLSSLIRKHGAAGGRCGTGVHARAVDALTSLLAEYAHCPACTGHFSQLVTQIAACTDSSVESWGNAELLVASSAWLPGVAGTKRRRADPHLKELAARAAVERKEGKASGQLSAASSTVRGWDAQRICASLATGHIHFRLPQVVSSAFDAARIGRPAQELLLHCLWHHADAGALILPPAASRSGCEERVLACS